MLAKQLLNQRDRRIGALDQRMTMFGISDSGIEHLGERHAAVVAQQHHPRVEHSGHASGEQTSSRNDVDAFRTIMRNRRLRRRRALSADDIRAPALDVVKDHRNVATRSVEMGFDNLKGKGCCHCSIERVAAFF